MKKKKYMEIIKHYESCLEKYGDSHLGVDWPKIEDVDKRYKVLLSIINPIPEKKITLLDFGCGASHLYEYILKHKMNYIEYFGLDISEKFIELSKKKFPDIEYFLTDILEDNSSIPNFDYIIMAGIFTEKVTLSYEEMLKYFKTLLKIVFNKAKIGIAFNVMSKHVDWERDDLFHLPFDTLANFMKKELSRHFIIRNDYGLFEYTVYLYKTERLK